MRSLRPAMLLIAGLGLTGCVGVNDGYVGQPYGSTYSGNSRLVTPYRYPDPASGYLYDQSRRSRQGNTYRAPPNYRPPSNYRPPPQHRPNPNYGQSRNNNSGRNNPPGHNNPPGRGNGRDND